MAKKILVVEDSATELRVMTDLLRRHGYSVITAGDGEQALTMLEADRPDLLVLDIILPKINGYTLCRKIRQTPELKDLPIVMVSSKNLESDIHWGMKLGADAYVTKPFTERALLDQVSHFC